MQPVIATEHVNAEGKVVAQAQLNSEATLNSLSLDMIDLLTPKLNEWSSRDEVVCVLITGAGDKAFCAGGDIQSLYHAMTANHHAGEVVDEYPFDFFEREYRLDYQLHTYPKPVVCLGHGIVMGGGLGIFSAARHRIVTEKTRIALPEVTIGLFPDAGATWLLRNIPTHWALFMGLTGCNINAGDALTLNLGTQIVPVDQRDKVLEALLQISWHTDPKEHNVQITGTLESLSAAVVPATQLTDVPDSLSVEGTYADVAARVAQLRGINLWVDRGIQNMQNGCPTTVGIVVEQLRRAASMTLAQCFAMELTVGTHCAQNADFQEGVRALLIDKDGAPSWQFGDLESLPEAYVLSHFDEPWPANPLANLH